MKKAIMALTILAVLAPGAGFCDTSAKLQLTSGTLLGAFSQENTSGKKDTGVPAYEFLGIDVTPTPKISAHFYGWGRYDAGDFYDPPSTADLAYFYLRYADDALLGLDARLGRMHLMDTPSALAVDGASASLRPFPWLGFSAWGGLPVDLNDTNSSTGDSAYGGSVFASAAGWGRATVSYMRLENDSTIAQELVSVDAWATPHPILAVYARGVYDTEGKLWQSRSVSAPISIAGFTLTPGYSFVSYESLFASGARTAKPFSDPIGVAVPLYATGEELTTAGFDFAYDSSPGTMFGVKYKNYSYKIRPDDAFYFALLAGANFGIVDAGVEVGRMNGGTDKDTYDLTRVWGQTNAKGWFLGADAVYAKYGEKIFGPGGSDDSLAVSLSCGMNLPREGERVRLTLSYADDPNFKSDLRALASYEFAFSR